MPETVGGWHRLTVIQDAADLAKRLVDALEQARVTDAALAKACGVTPQAITGWKHTGRVHKRHLQTIAAMTGKSVGWLLGDERADPLEHQLLQMYRQMSPSARDGLLLYANWLLAREQERPSAANPYPRKARR